VPCRAVGCNTVEQVLKSVATITVFVWRQLKQLKVAGAVTLSGRADSQLRCCTASAGMWVWPVAAATTPLPLWMFADGCQHVIQSACNWSPSLLVVVPSSLHAGEFSTMHATGKVTGLQYDHRRGQCGMTFIIMVPGWSQDHRLGCRSTPLVHAATDRYNVLHKAANILPARLHKIAPVCCLV
jgi:hypothetical protein